MRKLFMGLMILAAISAFTVSLKISPVNAKATQAAEGARRITPVDLRLLLKKGQAIVVDVRTEEAYKAGHIKGAWLIPASNIANRAEELPRDKLIATYCS
jgi:3-mercaptopyruvate sulfurtransferase SseA